ncbi:MAG: hypothetical protein ABIR68_05655 [Ilumatobacteraceae bacterium]
MSATRARRRNLSVVTALVLLGAAGCSSDTKSTASTVAVTSPEDRQADDATVTAGLGKMVTTAASVTASVAGGTKVADAGEQLEADWSQVEGTVKTKEPDSYILIEDAISGLDAAGKAGDAAGATKASTGLATAVAAYLAKHP